MIVSNIIHMLLVKKNTFSRLAIPVSPDLFGQNKTWRGLLVLPILNGVLFWTVNFMLPMFSHAQAILIGALLGLVYMLFELPNSWLKRRLGIKSGREAKKNAFFFKLLDKMDSALGVSLASKFIFQLDWFATLSLFLLAVFIHIFFSGLLVVVNVKKRF